MVVVNPCEYKASRIVPLGTFCCLESGRRMTSLKTVRCSPRYGFLRLLLGFLIKFVLLFPAWTIRHKVFKTFGRTGDQVFDLEI